MQKLTPKEKQDEKVINIMKQSINNIEASLKVDSFLGEKIDLENELEKLKFELAKLQNETSKYTKENISDYQDRLSEEQIEIVLTHCNKEDIEPTICAWYEDLQDFYSDWVENINYSEEEADELLDTTEFITFDNGSIIRFAL
jgi:hypothetical protein